MADYGLLLSIAALLSLPALFAWRHPLRTSDGQVVSDVALPALGVGVVVGRVVSLALDDTRSLTRVGDFLIIRSGVEFWAGVVAGLLVIARSARRDQVGVLERFADIAPAALVAQAGYNLTCLVRDGCYGPDWALGPTPKGLSHGMLPVELMGSAALLAVAVLLASNRRSAPITILAGLGSLALVRAVTSFWLPRLGEGMTRQHITSVVVASACAAALAMVAVTTRRRSHGTAAAAQLLQ